MTDQTALLTRARELFHSELITCGAVAFNEHGTATIADRSQASSRSIALSILNQLGVSERTSKLPGQTQGSRFEEAVRNFVDNTLPELGSIRPGSWSVECVGGKRKSDHLAQYEPYGHLSQLASAIQKDRTLESVLGNIYVVSPDVLVVREPVSDDFINQDQIIVDGKSGNHSIIRSENFDKPLGIVHAVISCKFTMRSDRAQNARSEALNLIRNRKGRTPHIAVVTAEPAPSRLASLALGTGDIDMVYHMALPELANAVNELGNDESISLLNILIDGHRLRDISDLPLDLAV